MSERDRHILAGDLGWLEYAIADYVARWGEHFTGEPYLGEFGPNIAGLPTGVANMAMTVIRKNLVATWTEDAPTPADADPFPTAGEPGPEPCGHEWTTREPQECNRPAHQDGHHGPDCSATVGHTCFLAVGHDGDHLCGFFACGAGEPESTPAADRLQYLDAPESTPAAERWCAKHRDGWCAVVPNEEPAEGTFSLNTLCGYGITLPWGFDHRVPDCPDCLAVGDGPAVERTPEERLAALAASIAGAAARDPARHPRAADTQEAPRG